MPEIRLAILVLHVSGETLTSERSRLCIFSTVSWRFAFDCACEFCSTNDGPAKIATPINIKIISLDTFLFIICRYYLASRLLIYRVPYIPKTVILLTLFFQLLLVYPVYIHIRLILCFYLVTGTRKRILTSMENDDANTSSI